MADYRFANNEEDYVIDTWECFDLSSLGAVHTISFSLSSTKNNAYGILTPAYFCIDDFNGEAPTPPTPPQDEPPYIANPVADVVMDVFPQTVEINLEGVASDPDDPDEGIVYSLVTNSNETEVTATITEKTLTITRLLEESAVADLTLRASSDGQTVDFIIHVVLNEYLGVEEKELAIEAYPNPCQGMLFLSLDDVREFEYSIINMMGQTITQGHSQGQETMIDLSQSPAGVYLISAIQDGKRFVQKLVLN